MPDNIVLWVFLLLSGPLAMIALVPVLNPLNLLLGKKFVFTIQAIKIDRLSMNAPGELGIFEISAELRNETGEVINYAYRRISRSPQVVASVGDVVELFAVGMLTEKFGWSSKTAYTHNRYLRDSFLIYQPYWFLGVLPFASASYALLCT